MLSRPDAWKAAAATDEIPDGLAIFRVRNGTLAEVRLGRCRTCVYKLCVSPVEVEASLNGRLPPPPPLTFLTSPDDGLVGQSGPRWHDFPHAKLPSPPWALPFREGSHSRLLAVICASGEHVAASSCTVRRFVRLMFYLCLLLEPTHCCQLYLITLTQG